MLLLGIGVIHLMERTELVSGETCVTICVAVRGVQREKKRYRKREREREREAE
jgi:hypothetical protein